MSPPSQHRAVAQKAFDAGYVALWDMKNKILLPQTSRKKECSDTDQVIHDFSQSFNAFLSLKR